MRQVGKELGVNYIAEGSVRKDRQASIVSQLIDEDGGMFGPSVLIGRE
jgi:TolB-like protein